VGYLEDTGLEADAFEERLLDFVLAVEQQLDADPEAALDAAERADPELARHPEVRLAHARALVAARGALAGKRALEKLVGENPDFAEARHALALAYETLGDRRSAVTEFLAVRRLDAANDIADGFDLAALRDRIAACTAKVFEGLPSKFREPLGVVPILVEDRPSKALVADGFDPRGLGLFEGPDDAEHRLGSGAATPTRIVLYAANLAAFVDPADGEELEREVEITVLHEIGHYFGLDEEELDALGLA
jgi:predicted Zn-dependent protease with MMP-like domain